MRSPVLVELVCKGKESFMLSKNFWGSRLSKNISPSPSSKCGDEVNQACRAAVITTKDGKVEYQRSCCKGDDCKTVHGDVDGGHLDQVRYNNKHFYEPNVLSLRRQQRWHFSCPTNDCNTMDPRSSDSRTITSSSSLLALILVVITYLWSRL